MTGYLPKHFSIVELVPEELYKTLHPELMWGLFDDKLLKGLDYLKELFPRGAIIINDWYWGGRYSQSGIRTQNSPYYLSGSMHSVGKAVDLKFTEYEIKDAYEKLKYDKKITKYFSRMEHIDHTPTWIHLDQKEPSNGFPQLYVFKP